MASLDQLIRDEFESKIPNIDHLLVFCTANSCSDLYIKVGQQPFISRYGKIYQVPSFPVSKVVWEDWAKRAISSENNAKYVRQKMLDMSYIVVGETIKPEWVKQSNDFKPTGLRLSFAKQTTFPDHRYRVSCGFSMGKNIATFRMISTKLPSFSTINFPENAANILHTLMAKRGKIILFVGATGSGKSTSLVACLNDFSQPGKALCDSTVISLEDPVEYLIPCTPHMNIVQKELGVDFKEFSTGIKQALREHPNFINVGETRDVETIKALVEASRTGHGVVSSFHASDIGDTLARIYNYLVKDNGSIMYDLLNNIGFIICQRLIPSETGFRMNTQWLVFTNQIVSHLIGCIDQGKNIPVMINSLLKNENLLKLSLAKDWDPV